MFLFTHTCITSSTSFLSPPFALDGAPSASERRIMVLFVSDYTALASLLDNFERSTQLEVKPRRAGARVRAVVSRDV